MKNLKIFNTPDEIRTYIQNRKIKLIGYGVEGYAYLDRNNAVLKEVREGYALPYDNTIIFSNEFNLETFIFPDEVYIADDIVYGYKTRYFPNDVFCDIYRENAVEIDLLKLIKARNKAIEDIKEITELGYAIDDLVGNVLFDGEKLALIDTLCYVKDYYISVSKNIDKLNQALDYKLAKIDPLTSEWNMPFDNKINLLMRKNKSNKVLVKQLDI